MKLFNHTKIDNQVLEKVLYLSAKAVGSIRTQKVVIKITAGQRRLHGRVSRSNYYRWFLVSKRRHLDKSYTKRDKQVIYSDGGTMLLTIPLYYGDSLRTAESIYSLMAHEWRHVKDNQKGIRFGDYNRNWKNRPHERRAMNAEKKAIRVKDKRDDIQEAVINLGIEIERIENSKKPKIMNPIIEKPVQPKTRIDIILEKILS